MINKDKSKFNPSRQASWLGFIIDLESGQIKVPNEKLDTLKLLLQFAVYKNTLTARMLASITTGKVISLSLALGSIAHLRTCELYAAIESRNSWGDVTITPYAKDELLFWLQSIDEFNGRLLWRTPAVRFVSSDASSTGYGSYVVSHGGHVSHGQWSSTEAIKSSTWRELRAVAITFKAFAVQLKNHIIRWFTDNQNVVRIIQVGSRNKVLQAEALDIYKTAIRQNIVLEPELIPREQNWVADYLSLIVDYDDWGLSPKVFQIIESNWGPHTVDRFENSTNAKLPRFNSRFMDYRSEAIDAFTLDWNGENNYYCPHIHLIPRVVFHAASCRCICTLVAPEWPSAIFWPIICSGHCIYANFVIDWIYLPSSSDTCVKGKFGASLFKDNIPTSNVLALRLDFSQFWPT